METKVAQTFGNYYKYGMLLYTHALQIQGKVSECLVSQNVQVVAECYAPVAYQRNQKQTSQGLEVDLLIKVLHVKQVILCVKFKSKHRSLTSYC